jgi:Cu-Zn family superoxide dismutase
MRFDTQMRAGIGAAALGILLVGCSHSGTSSMGRIRDVPPKLMVTSEVIAPSGDPLGKAIVSQEADGTRVHLEIHGLPPGSYGVHLHAIGKCEGPGFTSAGGHFNPGMKQHGSMNPAGEHAGDLPNIIIGDNSQGTLDALQKGLRLADGPAPLLNADGASIMVHAGPDDFKTDPSGNSGTRIACGVLRTGKPG